MATERYLLDTSAIFTLIEDEAGAGRIEDILSGEECILPWMVLLEATYITRRERGEAEAERRYALLKQLPALILWEIDEPVLLTAARIKSTHSLSLADAMIAAYAYSLDAVLVHKDPEFESLTSLIRLEALPFN